MENLLQKFEEFELNANEKKEIKAGRAQMNGCRQNGSNSYADTLYDGWYQVSDEFIGSSDASGWCASQVFPQP